MSNKSTVVGNLKEKARFYIADDIPIKRETLSIGDIRGTEARGKGTGEHLPESALKEPIIVARQKDGTYALLDGHHRVKVLKSRGVTEIDAVVGHPELRYSQAPQSSKLR